MYPFLTYGGGSFEINSDPADVSGISLADIAHSLALTCRFNGHCRRFYSVAQHSLHVAEQVPDQLKVYGLLHDAAEAYIGDIIRPVKELLGARIRKIEDNVLTRIMLALDLPWPLKGFGAAMIKTADDRMLATEMRDLFYPQVTVGDLKSYAFGITPMHSITAEMDFMGRFDEYKKLLSSSS